MPRVVHILGDVPREPVETVFDLTPHPAIAWTMDPFAPVPAEYAHLVEVPPAEQDPSNEENE